MDRNAVGRVALALVGVVSVAVAAATLGATVDPSGGAVGLQGNGSGGLVPPPEQADGTSIPVLLPPEVLALVAALVAVATLLYVLAYPLDAFKHVAVVVGALLVVVLVALFLSELLSAVGGGEFGGASGDLIGDSAGGGVTTGEGELALPSPLLVLLVGAALVGAVGVLVGARRRQGEPADEPPGDGAAGASAEVGRAAGRAADRIDRDAAADNEVYRAWREMTDLLDVPDPETSTPGEFAAAAVEAGMDREDVDELTRLFEEVRYGGASPTDEYEQRAVAVLRRIEAAYAGEGGADA